MAHELAGRPRDQRDADDSRVDLANNRIGVDMGFQVVEEARIRGERYLQGERPYWAARHLVEQRMPPDCQSGCLNVRPEQ
jgi:hypothetical protein